MKRSLFVLVILIFLLSLLGFVTLQRGLVILALPLLFYFIAAWFLRPEGASLSLQRSIEPVRAVQGKPITVTLTIKNIGKDVAQICARDQFSRKLHIEDGFTSVIAHLPAGETMTLNYSVSAYRGAYQHFIVETTTDDLSGCFEVVNHYQTPSLFMIHPERDNLKSVRIRPTLTHGFGGSIASRSGGTGVDFFTVREYQQGDSLRHINWKMSARDDRRFYTNVMEQEQVTDVGIILDARQRVNLINNRGSLFEYGVRAAASLSQRFLDDGHRVSLLVYGSGKKRVFPGYGKHQSHRILDTLASVTPIINFALSTFDNLPVRFFRPGSQIVMISPIVMEDIPYINKMRAYGYDVLVISPNPVAFEAAEYEDNSSLAYRLAFAEREFMLQQLRQSGTQVINWKVDQSLEGALQRASFGMRAALHNQRRGV